MGDVSKEFEDKISDKNCSLHLLQVINLKDNPSSKILRKIYVCKSSLSKVKKNPTVHPFPIYAKSYHDAPAVHRIYSDAYKHLLFSYCRHFDSQINS